MSRPTALWGCASLLVCLMIPGRLAHAGNWPTYQHDAARSGVTAEELPDRLPLAWTHRPRHAPEPAWSDPQPKPVEGYLELPRVRFDDAFHVAAVGGRIYFGSSADHNVYCLDANTGRIVWTFATAGPIRLAPTVHAGRVYVGSDDGLVYCLAAADGKEMWRFRPGPADERVLGRGKMMSRWPVRTGVLIDGDVAYVGAGLFPAEGLFFYALDAATGKVLWVNDSTAKGGLSGLSPQGYMLASDAHLFLMSGRAGPAMLDRKTGEFLVHKNLHRWSPAGPHGGTFATLHGQYLYGGMERVAAYDTAKKLKEGHAWVTGRRVLVTDRRHYVMTGTQVQCWESKTYPEATRLAFAARTRAKEHAARKRAVALLALQRAGAVKARAGARKKVETLESKIRELQKPAEPTTRTGKAPSPSARPAATASASASEAERNAKAQPNAVATTKPALTPEAVAQIKALRKQLGSAKKALAAAESKAKAVDKKYQAEAKALAALAKIVADAPKLAKKAKVWERKCPHWDAMILAGKTLYVGGPGEVLALHEADGKQIARYAIKGKARGLAVADGRLLVSADTGEIHCYTAAKPAKPAVVEVATKADPYGGDAGRHVVREGVKALLQESGITRGYALILGALGEGQFAYELATQSTLQVYLVARDADSAAAARKALAPTGLLGTRICLDEFAGAALPYPDYFANLILDAESGLAVREIVRMLKPCGGKLLTALPQGVAADKLAKPIAGLKKQFGEDSGLTVAVRKTGVWVDRGPLPGAGQWTHQYGEPGNTACSDDYRVKGSLGVLWFGEPGPTRMPSRHGSAPAPLAMDGRMFIQTEESVLCVDCYNGLPLWERPLQGAVQERLYGTGMKMEMSNFVAEAGKLYVVLGATCHRLDAATGKVERTYDVPAPKPDTQPAAKPAPTKPPAKPPAKPVAPPYRWGYLAIVDGVLYGTRTPKGRTGDCLFAVDAATGKLVWQVDGKHILHDTIAVGGQRVYFVDRSATPAQIKAAADDRPKGLKPPRKDRKGKPVPPDVRIAHALAAKTGKVVWTRPVDVSDCVRIGRAGGDLAGIYANEVYLLTGQPWNGHFWREFFAGEFSRRSLIALAAAGGHELWSGHKGYRSRPLVVGDTIYAEPWAYDLYSGQPKMRTHPVTGEESKWQMARPGHHCGCLAAAPNYLLFRSGTTAYYDLEDDAGTAHFGAQRPGCWINFLPANGLLLIPEASSGCVCPFSIHTTVVMAPRTIERAWKLASAPDPMTPVKQLHVNLGAPGDRRAPDGVLWLGYPRPWNHRLAIRFKLGEKFHKGGEFVRDSHERVHLTGTPLPWLHSYGARGLASCRVPLFTRKDPGGAEYTVRLHFIDIDPADAPPAVFDIKLQGKIVAKAVDLAKESARQPRPVVKEFQGVASALDMEVALVPTDPRTPPARLPVLSAIEVVRTKLLPKMPKPPKPTTKPAAKPAPKGKKPAPKAEKKGK